MKLTFEQIKNAGERPSYYEKATAKLLWTDPYISKNLLKMHLDPSSDRASFPEEKIDTITEWLYKNYLSEKDSSYLDLGCGPGLYTSRIAQRGVPTAGVDFSKNSLKYARSQAALDNLNIDYTEGNYVEMKLEGSYDLVTLIWCDICVLSSDDLQKLFQNVKRVLKPNGVFIFDFHTDLEWESCIESSWWECFKKDSFFAEGEHIVFGKSFKYDNPKAHCEKLSIYRQQYDPLELYLWINYYNLREIEEQLNSVGLKVAESFSGDQFPLTKARDVIAISATLKSN